MPSALSRYAEFIPLFFSVFRCFLWSIEDLCSISYLLSVKIYYLFCLNILQKQCLVEKARKVNQGTSVNTMKNSQAYSSKKPKMREHIKTLHSKTEWGFSPGLGDTFKSC